MDKILSSFLCCTFGSRAEQRLSASSASSSRNTSETNNRTDSKAHDNQDDVEDVSINNMDNNNISNKSETINTPPGATNNTLIINNKPTTAVSSQSNSKTSDSKEISNEVPANETINNLGVNANKTPPTISQTTTLPIKSEESDQHSQTSDESDQDDSKYYSEENGFPRGFDLVALQPDQSCASTGFLLENRTNNFEGKKCLVLDLDETLVHSSFKYLRSADFVIPVEIEGQVHNVYVIKRPGVDEFMKRVGELYEVVVFTASVSRYGDPLLDELDIHNSVHHRLFRDSCYNYQGNYIKNLSQIGRPLSDLIIIDNSPASYIFHPQHAVPISSWFSDAHDNELLDLLPFLEDLAKPDVDDVSLVLDVTTT